MADYQQCQSANSRRNTFTASRLERQPTTRQEEAALTSRVRDLKQQTEGLSMVVAANSAAVNRQGQALAEEGSEIRETLRKEVKSLREDQEKNIDVKNLSGEEKISYLLAHGIITEEEADALRAPLQAETDREAASKEKD